MTKTDSKSFDSMRKNYSYDDDAINDILFKLGIKYGKNC